MLDGEGRGRDKPSKEARPDMTGELPMKIGMVGLGRMGANMVRRLRKAGHQCRVYDLSEQAVKQLAGETVTELLDLLAPGDAIVDGGNSSYRDDIDRAQIAASRGIDYVDSGTSGGVWGREAGYCLMIGGPDRAVGRLEPIFAALAPGVAAAPRTPGRTGKPSPSEQGFLHCGPSGLATSSRWSTTASSTP
jgi:6-phosphogluconate dehydrogenase